MTISKATVGKGEAPASPGPEATKGERSVANTKVRVLYPTAFTAAGVEVWNQTRDKAGRLISEELLEEVSVPDALATALIQAGHAEKIGKE